MHRLVRAGPLLTLALVAGGCSGGPPAGAAGGDSGGWGDSGPPDSGTADSGVADSGTADSGREDTGDTSDSGDGPVDADGDGYLDDVDCDDADPTVHPGATDVCDGVDRDCDGSVVGEGGCGEVTQLAEAWPIEFSRDQYYASLDCSGWPGCVWTQGGQDLLVDRTGWESGDVGMAIFRWDGSTFGYALQLTSESYQVYDRATVVGDFDGDGTDDLAIHGGSGRGSYQGAIALISGDSTGWPSGLTRVDDAAYGVWDAVTWGDDFSTEMDVGDVDGDGLVDIVAHAPAEQGEEHGGKCGWLFVILGRTTDFPAAGDDPLPDEWYYNHSRDVVSRTPEDEAFSVLAVHPDLDGDGLADVISRGTSTGDLSIVPGANLVSMQGALVEELVEFDTARSDYESVNLVAGACSGMDLDGDGSMDCLITAGSPTATGQDLVVVSGSGIAAGLDIRTASLVTVGSFLGAGAHLVHDVDLDGIADIAFSPDRGMGCLAASSRLPLGGTVGPDEVAPCWEHDDVSRVVDVAVADIDGSGIPDLVLSAQPYEARAPIPLYVLPELALPWGDSTRW